MATYYERNKHERLEYQKKYNAINNDRNKEYHKKFYAINSDKYKEYQKKYNAINNDKRKEYERAYYQNVLKYVRECNPKIKVKKTKITKGFLKDLEKICKRKINDYYDTLEAEQEAIELSKAPKPFEGFTVRNGMFLLKF